MAEIFEQIDGWCRPRIICDACQQPINNFRSAMVVYEEIKQRYFCKKILS